MNSSTKSQVRLKGDVYFIPRVGDTFWKKDLMLADKGVEYDEKEVQMFDPDGKSTMETLCTVTKVPTSDSSE